MPRLAQAEADIRHALVAMYDEHNADTALREYRDALAREFARRSKKDVAGARRVLETAGYVVVKGEDRR